jgi:DNA end-binding protein Ku
MITLSARAIWQGMLKLKTQEVGVKLYSAVEDRQIHFHLLHKRDKTRVRQRMVDAETDEPVAMDETRRAFEAGPGVFVVVTDEEAERSMPEASREVRIGRFVPVGAVDPRLFDRPYHLGPASEDATDYFALAAALSGKQRVGIASWVMRKHSYVGALMAWRGYLMLITLRHADEVIAASSLEAPEGATLEPKERDLAGKLIEALSGDFEPEAYHDHYQERVHELIDAKRAGKKVRPKKVVQKREPGSLAESLRLSVEGARRGRTSGK